MLCYIGTLTSLLWMNESNEPLESREV